MLGQNIQLTGLSCWAKSINVNVLSIWVNEENYVIACHPVSGVVVGGILRPAELLLFSSGLFRFVDWFEFSSGFFVELVLSGVLVDSDVDAGISIYIHDITLILFKKVNNYN